MGRGHAPEGGPLVATNRTTVPTEHELRSERSLHLRTRHTEFNPFSHLSGCADTTGFKTLPRNPRLHAQRKVNFCSGSFDCVTRRGLNELLASLIRDEDLVVILVCLQKLQLNADARMEHAIENYRNFARVVLPPPCVDQFICY